MAPKGLKASTKNEAQNQKVTVTPQADAQQEEVKDPEQQTANPDAEVSADEDAGATPDKGAENEQTNEDTTQEDEESTQENPSGISVDATPPSQQVNENSPKVNVDLSSVKSSENKMPEERVKIRLRVDHNCCIAGEWYDFKAGKQYTVPKNVKRILNRAGYLAPL